MIKKPLTFWLAVFCFLYKFTFENFGEVPFYFVFYFFYIEFLSQLSFKGGYLFSLNPTRNDMLKISHIGIDIKCKTMYGNPARSLHAHGTDFPCKGFPYIQPNARFSLRQDNLQSAHNHDR